MLGAYIIVISASWVNPLIVMQRPSLSLIIVFFFFFPLYSKGVRLSLHVYIAITVFPPPFLL